MRNAKDNRDEQQEELDLWQAEKERRANRIKKNKGDKKKLEDDFPKPKKAKVNRQNEKQALRNLMRDYR